MTPALSLRSTLGIEREHTLDIFWKPSPELPTAQLPAPTLEIMGQVGGEPLGRSGRHLSRAGSTPSTLPAQLVKGDGAAEQEVGGQAVPRKRSLGEGSGCGGRAGPSGSRVSFLTSLPAGPLPPASLRPASPCFLLLWVVS